MQQLGDRHADGALVQEGGYNIPHLGYAMLATLQGVRDDYPVEDQFEWMPADAESVLPAIEAVVDAHENAGAL